jgi:hypothetical protein
LQALLEGLESNRPENGRGKVARFFVNSVISCVASADPTLSPGLGTTVLKAGPDAAFTACRSALDRIGKLPQFNQTPSPQSRRELDCIVRRGVGVACGFVPKSAKNKRTDLHWRIARGRGSALQLSIPLLQQQATTALIRKALFRGARCTELNFCQLPVRESKTFASGLVEVPISSHRMMLLKVNPSSVCCFKQNSRIRQASQYWRNRLTYCEVHGTHRQERFRSAGRKLEQGSIRSISEENGR